MIEFLDNIATDAGRHLLTASVQAGLLATLLIGVRATVGRRMPAWLFAAGWTLVVARLVVPVEIASPAGVWSYIPTQTTTESVEAPLVGPPAELGSMFVFSEAPVPSPPLTFEGEYLTLDDPGTDLGQSLFITARAEPAPVWLEPTQGPDDEWATLMPQSPTQVYQSVVGVPLEVHTAESRSVPYALILAFVWLTGVVLVAWVVARRYRALARVLRDASPAPRHIALAATNCAGALNLRRSVRVLVSDRTSSAFITGVRRPTVVLPAHIADGFDYDELRCVIAHELCHAKRADVLVGWLGAAAGALHWFNPLAWAAVWLWNTDRERACDADAVTLLGPCNTKRYGLTLIKAALQANPAGRGLTLAAAFGPERTSEMTRRIQLLPRTRNTSRAARIAMTAGLVALASVTVTGAMGPAEEREQTAKHLEEALAAVRAGEEVSTEEIAELAAMLAELRNLEEELIEDEDIEIIVEGGHIAASPGAGAITLGNSVVTVVGEDEQIAIKGTNEDGQQIWVIEHTTDEHGEVTMTVEQLGTKSFQVIEFEGDPEAHDGALNAFLKALPSAPPAPPAPTAAGTFTLRGAPPAPAIAQTFPRFVHRDGSGNAFRFSAGPNGANTFLRRGPSGQFEAVELEELEELLGRLDGVVHPRLQMMIEGLEKNVVIELDEEINRALRNAPELFAHEDEDHSFVFSAPKSQDMARAYGRLLRGGEAEGFVFGHAMEPQEAYRQAMEAGRRAAAKLREHGLSIEREDIEEIIELRGFFTDEVPAAAEELEATRDALRKEMIELRAQMEAIQKALEAMEREYETIEEEVEVEVEGRPARPERPQRPQRPTRSRNRPASSGPSA